MEKMGKTDRKMARMESGFNQGVNILSIGPNSLPADIMLNARLSQMSDEERIKEILSSMLFFIGGHDDEAYLLWLKSLLRRVLELKQYDPACNNHQEFMLCLKAVYLCLTFDEADSKFSFPEFKEEFWKDLMKDWHVELYVNEPDQKILTFFLNRYDLAPKEEKKMMNDIFRQRLTNARAEDIEGWVKWIYAPGKPEAWCYMPEISRHLAIARASTGGRNLLLQDVHGGELLMALNRPEGFPAHLTMALKEAGDQIVDIDSAVKVLVEELTKLFSLDQERQERIEYIIYDTTFVAINLFCVCFYEPQIKEGRDCYKMANSIRTWLKRKEYMTEEDEIFLSGHKVSLLLQFNDVQGYSMFRKHLDKDREKG